MALVKNKSTEKNEIFWNHVEKVAEQIRHRPKWAGGEGIKPICCPTCNRPIEEN
jgi:hypothetical protein